VVPLEQHPDTTDQNSEFDPAETTVMLVDDYQPIRESLRLFLEHIVGVTTVREAGFGRDAIAMAERIQPDIIITDSNLPDVSGVEVVRNVSRLSPGSRTLFISAADDQFGNAYKAGAEACVLKDGQLFDAVRELMPHPSPTTR
jgi:DNA-binding NarL/FixJ family response regulator